MIQEPRGKFVKIRCKCKNEQIVFDKTATEIHCLVCGELLGKPRGGKTDFVVRPLEVLK